MITDLHMSVHRRLWNFIKKLPPHPLHVQNPNKRQPKLIFNLLPGAEGQRGSVLAHQVNGISEEVLSTFCFAISLAVPLHRKVMN